jgi:peptidoglycan/xylan/chitin deacetylase (PgdA/CDA1 family)
MRFFRPCFTGGWLYPGAIFRMKTEEKLLCLTFDDGPDTASTPQLLDILGKRSIKGIFFCNGRAAEKYPELMNQIIASGHLIGNHGYAHPDGWRTASEKYVADVSKASPMTSATLFRPPYGRLGLKQYRIIKQNYKIVFWDIMPYDFDWNFSSEKSFSILKKLIRPGSIIALHDKPASSALKFLPAFIEFAVENGYRFVLPEAVEKVKIH